MRRSSRRQPNVRKPLTHRRMGGAMRPLPRRQRQQHRSALAGAGGQRVDYLEKVLHAYRTGARKSPEMAAMSDVLTEADVENLAAYYARQKARAVVYVPVPSK